MTTFVSKCRPLAKLSLWLAALGLFVFVFPRMLSLIPIFCDFRHQIELRAIEPTALFYTEEPHTASSSRIIEFRIRPDRERKPLEEPSP